MTQVETLSEKAGSESWVERPGFAETLACALAFLIYIPTLGFQFVYDDEPQVIQNPAIHAWRYWPHYFTTHVWGELYPSIHGNYYRPLFLVWFRLNHALFGLRPPGWHFTTVLCHVISTYLVFVLLDRLSGKRGIALTGAVLFALHPVHIESVAWVSGVTDPLVTIFIVGSFLAYLRFHAGGGRPWMALALVLFAAGLLEKETAIVLGPLVFLYAWIYTETSGRLAPFVAALKSSLGFAVVSVLYLVLRAHVLHGLSHFVTPLTVKTLLLTEPSVIWLYARHLIWPTGISALYGLPYVKDPHAKAFWIPALLLFLTLAVALWSVKRLRDRKLAWFGFWWMVIPILPVLWLRAYSEGDIAHDRYLYFPSIGFVLLVAMLLDQAFEDRLRARKGIQIAVVSILAAAYAIATFTQESYWATDLQLYQRAYSIAPRDNLIVNNLGSALFDAGYSNEAISFYLQVLNREPTYWISNYDLGFAYYKLGKFPQAEFYFSAPQTRIRPTPIP